MSELSELYQEVIVDHSRSPRNFGALPGANRVAVGHNPLCGDQIAVEARLEGEAIREVRFQGSGCAISKASASMMTQALAGRSRAEAEALFDAFHKLVTGETADASALGKLAAFAGVSEFPVRVKCATLAWHTLKAALDQKKDTVSTE